MRSMTSSMIGVLLLIVLASPALAHAERTTADPEAGSRLDEPPQHLYINFTEPPTADARVTVTDGCDRDVVANVEAQQQTLHMNLDPGQPGRWKVAFEVVSGLDGHPTRDSFGFRVRGEADCSEEPTEEPTPRGGVAAPDEGDEGGAFPIVPVIAGVVLVIGAAALIRLRG